MNFQLVYLGEEHLFEPTYDRSILLVRNLNPNTGKDTIQDFIESTKHVEVLKIVLGVGGKAIVILKNEIGWYIFLSFSMIRNQRRCRNEFSVN